MFRFITAIALLFLVSCTCPGIIGDIMTDQPFITEHGIEVDPQDSWVSQAEIEKATEIFILDVSKKMPEIYSEDEMRRAIDGTRLLVEEHNFGCVTRNQDDGKLYAIWCLGTFDSMRNTVRYVNDDCIGDAAFIHEFIHLINKRIEHVRDYYHERKEFFGDDKGSFEHDINEHVIDELCPSCWGIH